MLVCYTTFAVAIFLANIHGHPVNSSAFSPQIHTSILLASAYSGSSFRAAISVLSQKTTPRLSFETWKPTALQRHTGLGYSSS